MDCKRRSECKSFNNLSYFGIQEKIKLVKGNLENPNFLNDEIKNKTFRNL